MPEPSSNACRVDCRDSTKPDKRPDVSVARAAADQWGVLALDELFACGLSPKSVLTRVRNGWLHPIHRGVYAVGHPNLPLEGRFLAAVKACGHGAVLSHHSAAALWGFMRWEDRRLEVTVVGTAPRAHPGLRVHRTTTLDSKPLRSATRRAQSLYRVNVRQLVDVLARHRRRRGCAGLARIVATGPAPTRSELEDATLDLMLRGGLAHPDVNVALWLSGRRVVPDFRWPEQRLVVEADGAAWHDNQLAREDDAERQALLEADGERVLRVTWDQVIMRPGQTLSRIRAAGAPLAQRTSGAPSG